MLAHMANAKRDLFQNQNLLFTLSDISETRDINAHIAAKHLLQPRN